MVLVFAASVLLGSVVMDSQSLFYAPGLERRHRPWPELFGTGYSLVPKSKTLVTAYALDGTSREVFQRTSVMIVRTYGAGIR